MEPQFNKPLYNEVVGITNHTLQPGQSYRKILWKEPPCNKIFVITNTIQKPKCIICPDITKYRHAMHVRVIVWGGGWIT